MKLGSENMLQQVLFFDTTDRQPLTVALEEWIQNCIIMEGLQRQPWPYDLFLGRGLSYQIA